MSKAYRTNAPYRSRGINYRGNQGRSPRFAARDPIAGTAARPFKLEEVNLPGGRTATRIVTL